MDGPSRKQATSTSTHVSESMFLDTHIIVFTVSFLIVRYLNTEQPEATGLCLAALHVEDLEKLQQCIVTVVYFFLFPVKHAVSIAAASGDTQ